MKMFCEFPLKKIKELYLYLYINPLGLKSTIMDESCWDLKIANLFPFLSPLMKPQKYF